MTSFCIISEKKLIEFHKFLMNTSYNLIIAGFVYSFVPKFLSLIFNYLLNQKECEINHKIMTC